MGVVPTHSDGRPSTLHPVYSGATLPPLKGAMSDRARIERAWSDRQCVLVEGKFQTPPSNFEVENVLGRC